jgi:hypothetical protein
MIDSIFWKRPAAIRERLCRREATIDIDVIYRNLPVNNLRLGDLGLTHETNVDVLLGRLAGGSEIEPLKLRPRKSKEEANRRSCEDVS